MGGGVEGVYLTIVTAERKRASGRLLSAQPCELTRRLLLCYPDAHEHASRSGEASPRRGGREGARGRVRRVSASRHRAALGAGRRIHRARLGSRDPIAEPPVAGQGPADGRALLSARGAWRSRRRGDLDRHGATAGEGRRLAARRRAAAAARARHPALPGIWPRRAHRGPQDGRGRAAPARIRRDGGVLALGAALRSLSLLVDFGGEGWHADASTAAGRDLPALRCAPGGALTSI